MNEFRITCLQCGSDNCEIVSEDQYEYNYDEELEYWGTDVYIRCNDCGNNNK